MLYGGDKVGANEVFFFCGVDWEIEWKLGFHGLQTLGQGKGKEFYRDSSSG